MFAGLMSRCTSPHDSASESEWHICREHIEDPFGRYRAEAPDESVGVETVEQLHHVIERAVVGDAEVEQRHGVRRSEAAR